MFIVCTLRIVLYFSLCDTHHTLQYIVYTSDVRNKFITKLHSVSTEKFQLNSIFTSIGQIDEFIRLISGVEKTAFNKYHVLPRTKNRLIGEHKGTLVVDGRPYISRTEQNKKNIIMREMETEDNKKKNTHKNWFSNRHIIYFIRFVFFICLRERVRARVRTIATHTYAQRKKKLNAKSYLFNLNYFFRFIFCCAKIVVANGQTE